MKNTRALVLPVTIGLMLMFFALGFAVVQLSDMYGQSHAREVLSTQAFWIAEAGLQKGYREIIDGNCVSFGCANCDTCQGPKTMTVGTLNQGTYLVQLTTENPSMQLTSQGNASAMIKRSVKADVVFPFFQHAVFSIGEMTIKNNVLIDSYTSSKLKADGSPCLYGETCADGTINQGWSGNIVTNSGTFNISNNVTINGTQQTNAGIIWNAAEIPDVLKNDTSPGYDQPLTINRDNDPLTLSSGNYKRTQIVFDRNQRTLIIDGEVSLYLTGSSAIQSGNGCEIRILEGSKFKLYVDGTIELGNNVLLNNVYKVPNNFIIYSNYTGPNGVIISNNGSFYGSIYAPFTDVKLDNNTTVAGSIVGGTVTLDQNADVFFDEMLKEFIDFNQRSSLRLSNWREVK